MTAAGLRPAVRMISREPLQSAAIVLTLALGIGVNTAIFSVVHAALKQPAAYPQAQQLVDIRSTTPADFMAWRDQSTSFAHFGGYVPFGSLDLTGGGEPERLQCHFVTADYFHALAVGPLLGRTFSVEEEKPGNDQVVVLSHALWQRRFNSDPDVVGLGLTLNGSGYTVVGVMPRHFGGRGQPADLWAPLSFGPHRPADRNSSYVGMVARLNPGVTLDQARAEMDTICRRLEEDFPDTNEGLRAVLRPLVRVMTSTIKPTMMLLVGAVGFVLLIACVNVSNLLLARGVARQQELSLHSALGATRGRLLRRLLAESLLLCCIGTVLGLVLAFLIISLLPDLRGTYTYHHTEVRLNFWVLGMTLGVSVLVGIVVGLIPSIRASRPNLTEALGSGGRSAMKSARSQRLQGALVIGEIAIAFVLLVGAGVMVRSLFHLQNTDRGFDPARVLTMEIAPPQTRYPEGADVVAFFGELIDRLSHQPGVEAAAAGNSQPGTGWTFLPQIEGREENRENKARFLLITPDYFQTLGIPLLKGRAFTPDDRLGQRPVMIINEIAADRLFPGEEPIGRRLSFNGREDLHEVVGVVGNVANPREEAPSSACYIPLYQQPVTMRSVGQNSVAVFLRTHGDPLELVAPLRRAIGSLDSDLPISNVQSMDQHLAQTIFRPRLNAALLAGFAALALFLASVGIFSLVAFNVNQRLPEIGIRMALGAERPRVLRLVMKRGLVLALPGIGIGLGAGLALSRFLESLVVGVSPLDPWTYVVVSLLLLGVVMLTCLVPAYRASRLDPAVTLRTE